MLDRGIRGLVRIPARYALVLAAANRYRALIGPDCCYLPGDARDELLTEDIWR